jgi:hypothetical protein
MPYQNIFQLKSKKHHLKSIMKRIIPQLSHNVIVTVPTNYLINQLLKKLLMVSWN